MAMHPQHSKRATTAKLPNEAPAITTVQTQIILVATQLESHFDISYS